MAHALMCFQKPLERGRGVAMRGRLSQPAQVLCVKPLGKSLLTAQIRLSPLICPTDTLIPVSGDFQKEPNKNGFENYYVQHIGDKGKCTSPSSGWARATGP